MTVSSIIPVNTYTGNSSVKKFDFDFLIEDEKELVVQHISENSVTTTLTLGVDYSINEIGNQNGSYIIFPLESSSYNVLKENEKISLMLDLIIKQESEFKNSSYFNLNILEWTFDYLVRILQILNRKIERCVKVGEGLSVSPDELLNELNESKRIALNAADSAMQAQKITEENKTDSIRYLENFNKKALEFNDVYQSCYRSIIDSGIDTRSNVDLSNLTSTGEKHFLNKSQITNCLLEVPQNIKYELSDSGFTLKAGSVVIFPNGTDNYEHYTLAKDITFSSYGSGSDDFFICLRDNKSSLLAYVVNKTTSGTTAPTGEGLWYDTANNIVKFYNSSNALQYSDLSLPVAICTRSSGTITGVKQVFNGLGYIGSTIWCDKGVKALIPNGRNTDGCLNNIEFVTDKVYTHTSLSHYTFSDFGWIISADGIIPHDLTMFEYREDENYNYQLYANIVSPSTIIAIGSVEAGVITSFQPKTPFNAVDYNDLKKVQQDILSAFASNNCYKTIGTNYIVLYSDSAKKTKTLIIQWGSTSSSSGTLTLPMAMTTTSYNLSITPLVTGGLNGNQAGGYSAKTTTSFTYNYSNCNGVDWYICGY